MMLGRFVSFQILAQAIGLLSGLLLVRTLPRREYAFFTIANSMQGMMNLLADTGLSIGLTSIGGRVWQDRRRFGELVATTMQLRRRLALLAVPVVTPILLWMLVTNGSRLSYAGLLSLLVLVGLNFQLTISIFGVIPRLFSQVSRLQRLDFAAAVVRLAVLAAAYYVYLDAATAVFASVVMFGVQRVMLRRWALDGIDKDAAVNDQDRKELLRIVRNQMPTTIFYCIQGQVSIWLVSVFGKTSSVADLGALGRLSVMFVIITSVMTTIVVPRFAKYQSAQLLRRRFIQIMAGFLTFDLCVVAIAALFPDPILWVLGSKYASLRRELLLMMILTGANSTVEAMWLLNSAKAWIEYSWLLIPGTIITQAFLLTILRVSTLRGALLFGIFSLIPSALLNLWLASRGLRRTGLAANNS